MGKRIKGKAVEERVKGKAKYLHKLIEYMWLMLISAIDMLTLTLIAAN